MRRTRRSAGTVLAVAAAISLSSAGDVSAQYIRQRGAYAGFRAGWGRPACGPRACFTSVAPRFTACAPIIGRRAACGPALLNSTWCPPRCATVVVPPVVGCYNVNSFGLYPSSRLDCVGGPILYGGYYGTSFTSYTSSVSTVDAPDVTPDYAPPPGNYAGVSGPAVYGFRSVPTSGANGDRAMNQALLEYKRRQASGGTPAPASPPAPTPGDVQRAQQVGVALGRGDKDFEAGRYEQARDEYLHAMMLSGEDAGAQISYGMAQFALGKYGDAGKAMMNAASRQPPIDPASFDVRKAYGQPGDFTIQLGRLEQFVADHPGDLHALFLLGFVQSCGGDARAGGQRLREFSQKGPVDPALQPFLSLALGEPSTGG